MKIRYLLAALSVAALSFTAMAPSTASAETTVIKKVYRGNHGHHGHMRMHRHHDRGMHRGRMHRADKVVIIKKKRHY